MTLITHRGAVFDFSNDRVECTTAVVRAALSRGHLKEVMEDRDAYGRTAFMFAAVHGHPEVVVLLLGCGADIQAGTADDDSTWNPRKLMLDDMLPSSCWWAFDQACWSAGIPGSAHQHVKHTREGSKQR